MLTGMRVRKTTRVRTGISISWRDMGLLVKGREKEAFSDMRSGIEE